jgi:hypothetical protein
METSEKWKRKNKNFIENILLGSLFSVHLILICSYWLWAGLLDDRGFDSRQGAGNVSL